MPLGIDELLYGNATGELGFVPNPTPFVDLLGPTAGKGIRKFKFLSLFGWSYRKGPDILIRSFVEEFDANDDVALIIVARHSGSPGPEHVNIIRREAMDYARMVRGSNYPQVVLYPHVIPEQQMPSTYRMGHAFIQTSRGEGFSLPQIEASACGLPVISCNNTGMSEYLDETNAYLVKTDKTEVCNQSMHWITTYYHGQLFPKLGRDQIGQARKHMRFVMENYEQAKKKGKRLRDLVFDKYTWDHASRRVANRIREIYREL
jgi:glycosyltransferase involved in cell wall biosynthesis